jgi:hypothetical protein
MDVAVVRKGTTTGKQCSKIPVVFEKFEKNGEI